MKTFRIIKKSSKTSARAGVLKTAHGSIKTPFFMPVATRGAVKHISAEEMKALGAKILLANTYHLMLKPGEKLVKKAGGLHKFIGWDRPILTDSGGFQVFSLSGSKNKSGKSLVKLEKDGVKFRSYIDGREYYLTPEKVLQIQIDLGVDVAVCLDECVALPAKKEYVEKSVELTRYWAERTKKYYEKIKSAKKPLLFAVVQGGLDKNLRLESLAGLKSLNFDGYNIGGLSVGETAEEMYAVLDYLLPAMSEGKPRYLMGVGYPENILEAVKRGADMFDCVIPTREGRHGRLFSWSARGKTPDLSKKKFYKIENINNSDFFGDKNSINSASRIKELRFYSRAYLHYLFKIREPLGQRLATLNNLEFYLDFMERVRENIGNS